jgi:hypothetical protein
MKSNVQLAISPSTKDSLIIRLYNCEFSENDQSAAPRICYNALEGLCFCEIPNPRGNAEVTARWRDLAETKMPYRLE